MRALLADHPPNSAPPDLPEDWAAALQHEVELAKDDAAPSRACIDDDPFALLKVRLVPAAIIDLEQRVPRRHVVIDRQRARGLRFIGELDCAETGF
jgi:hypothetical protein